MLSKEIKEEKQEGHVVPNRNTKFISIGKKMGIMLTIISIVAVSFFGILSYKNSSDSLKEQMIISSSQSLEYVDLSIDNYLSGLENQLSILAMDPSILNYYENVNLGNSGEVFELAQSTLENLNTLDSNITQTFFSTVDNRSIIYPYVDLSQFDATTNEWFVLGEAAAGEAIWTDPYPDTTSGNMVVTLAKAVLIDDELAGVVGMDIDLSTLSSQLADLNIGETGYLIVTDANGVVLVDYNNERVGQNLEDDNELWKAISTSQEGNTETEYNGENRFTVYKTNERTGWKLSALIPETELLNSTRPILLSTALLGVIVIILVIVASVIVSKYISKILKKLQDGFNRAAEGDFTVSIDINSNDEFGELGKGFNKMIGGIRQLTKNVKTSSEVVVETSESILQMTDETNTAMNEISQTIQEVAKGSQEQAIEIDSNSENINELARLLDSISESTLEIRNYSEDSRNLGNKGLDEVKILTDKSEETRQEAENVNTIIYQVKESADRINVITETINQIAEQTNLLALNAAIEAARAGEAGKGFSVVADEIRKLAEQSSNATLEISKLITDMNTKTNDAVEAMGISIEAVGEQMKSVDSTKSVFGRIITSIQNLDAMVEKIKDSAVEMDMKKNLIVENTQNISAVSEEISASTEEVSASSEEVTAITSTFMEHSENLRKISEDLLEIVNTFTV